MAPPHPRLRQTCFRHGNGTTADTYLETENTFENLPALSNGQKQNLHTVPNNSYRF